MLKLIIKLSHIHAGNFEIEYINRNQKIIWLNGDKEWLGAKSSFQVPLNNQLTIKWP